MWLGDQGRQPRVSSNSTVGVLEERDRKTKRSYFYCSIPSLLTTWFAVTDHAVCYWFGDTRSGALSLTEIRERGKGDFDSLFFCLPTLFERPEMCSECRY